MISHQSTFIVTRPRTRWLVGSQSLAGRARCTSEHSGSIGPFPLMLHLHFLCLIKGYFLLRLAFPGGTPTPSLLFTATPLISGCFFIVPGSLVQVARSELLFPCWRAADRKAIF